MQHGNALRFAFEELRNDREIVMAAIQNAGPDGEALKHASQAYPSPKTNSDA